MRRVNLIPMAGAGKRFVDAGYTRAQGIEALTGFNLGAIPGILVLAFLTTRLPLVPLLSLFSCQPVPY